MKKEIAINILEDIEDSLIQKNWKEFNQLASFKLEREEKIIIQRHIHDRISLFSIFGVDLCVKKN